LRTGKELRKMEAVSHRHRVREGTFLRFQLAGESLKRPEAETKVTQIKTPSLASEHAGGKRKHKWG